MVSSLKKIHIKYYRSMKEGHLVRSGCGGVKQQGILLSSDAGVNFI